MEGKTFGLDLKVDLGKCFYRSIFRSLYSNPINLSSK